MALAQSNATLISVRGAVPKEDPGSDTPAGGAGAAIFDGNVRAYYRERRERNYTPQGLDVFIRRTLIVDTRSPAIEWKEGQIVTFSRDRGGVITGTVREATSAELSSLAGSGVETTRVEFEAE